MKALQIGFQKSILCSNKENCIDGVYKHPCGCLGVCYSCFDANYPNGIPGLRLGKYTTPYNKPGGRHGHSVGYKPMSYAWINDHVTPTYEKFTEIVLKFMKQAGPSVPILDEK